MLCVRSSDEDRVGSGRVGSGLRGGWSPRRGRTKSWDAGA
jgi:hypothetical protein